MPAAKALVLGSTGHIGSHIVRALLNDGHAVRAAYRSPRYASVLEGLDVERVRVDLDTPDGLRAALRGCDWIFHAAGYYPRFLDDREASIAKGVDAVRCVFRVFADERPARIVFTSSAATIRGVPGRASNESDAEPWPPTQPQSTYTLVKTAMEHEALRLASDEKLPVVVVNPSICIGEYDAHAFSGRLVLAFARKRLPFYVDYNFNAVYTGDVGVGHVRAAQNGRAGERYLLCGENLTLKALADIVCEEAGVRAAWFRIPYGAVLAAAAVSEAWGRLTHTEPAVSFQTARRMRGGQVLDGAKAARELDLPHTSIREAIRRSLRWFRENGYC